MLSKVDLLKELRDFSGEAEAVLSARRRADGELYAIIARLMSLAERVRDLKVEKDVREAYQKERTAEDGRSKRYIEDQSDIFTAVCRYSLDRIQTERHVALRTQIARIAAAMRAGHEAGQTSATISAWLSKNGGVHGVTRGRSNLVRCLRLTKPVSIPRDPGDTFVLTVRAARAGQFTVEDVRTK